MTDHGRRSKFCASVLQDSARTLSLAGVVLGFANGLIIRTYFPLSERDKLYIGFPGEILMRMFQLVSVPLIVTTFVTGVSNKVNIPVRLVRNVALYFVSTTLISVGVGLILAVMLKPGVVSTETVDEKYYFLVDPLLDLVRNMVPQNLIQACFQQYRTDRLEMETHTIEPNSSLETNETEVILVGNFIEGANTLGLVLYSVVFGLMLKDMEAKGRAIADVLCVLNSATKYVVCLTQWYLPVGVLFMVTSYIVELDDWESLYLLGYFMAVVVLGLIIHGAIVLPGIYLLSVRRNPWAVFKAVTPALWAALQTSSSSATLPRTFQCCEQRNGVNRKITRLMLPIGTEVNKNGTALYEVVAAVFVAQLNHINLDLSQLFTLGLTAAIATIKAMGIPATGAATTLFVLSTVGLPATEAAILVVVKELIDRCNIVVNVWGNCIAVALINQLSRNEVEEMEEQDANGVRSSNGETESQVEDTEVFYITPTSFRSNEVFHPASEDESFQGHCTAAGYQQQ